MAKIFPRLRILPVTIFFAVLMLSVKVTEIVDGFRGLPVARAVAQGQEGPQPILPPPGQEEAPPTPAAVAPTPPNPPPSDGPQPARRNETTTKSDAPRPEESEKREESALDDPSLFTENEIDLLQRLANRRETIETREAEVNTREGLLSAAERRINTKIQEMRQLQTTIQGLIKTHDEQEEKKLGSLVRIYENMKPKDAARIFEELDIDTLLRVAERMKERKLAPVMAKMNAEKAKQVTVELTRYRELPTPTARLPGT